MERWVLTIILAWCVTLSLIMAGCSERDTMTAWQARQEAEKICGHATNIIARDSCMFSFNYCRDKSRSKTECLEFAEELVKRSEI